MATGDEGGAATVYDAATRRPLGPPYRIDGGLIQNVRFSPDGRTLAVSSMDPKDPDHNGLVDLIDARTRERTLRVRLPRLPEPAPFVYTDVVFAPGGRDLVVRQVPGDAQDAPAPPVYRVDGKTGAVKDRLLVGQYAAYFYASRDRRSRAVLPHQPEREPDVGARPRAAAGRALLAGWRLGRCGQSRRSGVRSRLRRRPGPAARSGLRSDPAAERPPRGRREPHEVHARWADAGDFERDGRAVRVGRRARAHRAALRRPHRRDRRARPDGRRTHADHRVRRHARDPLGPRRGPAARPALHRRPPLRRRRHATRDRGQP